MGSSVSSSTPGSASASDEESACSYQLECGKGNEIFSWIETLFHPLLVVNESPPNPIISTCPSTSTFSALPKIVLVKSHSNDSLLSEFSSVSSSTPCPSANEKTKITGREYKNRLTNKFHNHVGHIVTVSDAPQRYIGSSSPQKRRKRIDLDFYNRDPSFHNRQLLDHHSDVNIMNRDSAKRDFCREQVSNKMTQPIAIPKQHQDEHHAIFHIMHNDREEEEKSELESIYDQATWRMYHRIMTSRMIATAANKNMAGKTQ